MFSDVATLSDPCWFNLKGNYYIILFINEKKIVNSRITTIFDDSAAFNGDKIKQAS